MASAHAFRTTLSEMQQRPQTAASHTERVAACLAAEDFDAKAWINARLTTLSADQARTLASELQTVAQAAAVRIERLSAETLAMIGQTATEIVSIQHETEQLAETLASAAHMPHIQRLSISTTAHPAPKINSTFARIALMSLVLERMEATRLCIKEAENWNSLPAEMEAILASGDYDKAAARLGEARRSLHLLSASASFSERQALFNRLCADLLDIVRPQLTAALANREADTAARLRTVFEQLGEASEFSLLYSQARCDPVLRIWSENYKCYDTPSTSTNDNLSWLNLFFDHILELASDDPSTLIVSSEYYQDDTSITSLASHSESALADPNSLIGFVFDKLEPSFSEWLCKFLDTRLSNGEQILPSLIQIYVAVCEFVNEAESRISRESFTRHISSWDSAIFEGFILYQNDYYDLEKSYLMCHVPSKLDYQDGNTLTVLLSQCGAKTITICESAIVRCNQLTFGLGFQAAVGAINHFLSTLANHMTRVLAMLQAPANAALLVSVLSSTSLSSSGQPNIDLLDASSLNDDSRTDFRAAVQVHNTIVGFVARCNTMLQDIGQQNTQEYAQNTTKSSISTEKNDIQISNSHPAHAYLLSAIDAGKVKFMDRFKVTSSAMQVSDIPAMHSMSVASQRLVFECLFRRVARNLDDLAKMPNWSSSSTGVASPFEMELPQFSLSPLPYIVRIGEQLLELPQHIDVFSSDPGMRFSLETLPFLLPGDLEHDDEEEESKDGSEEEDNVTHLWISSVSRAVESNLMDQIVQIPKLTPHGCKQLLADIDYFSNILAAMMIDVQPQLDQLRKGLGMDASELAATLKTKDAKSDILSKIAVIRGATEV